MATLTRRDSGGMYSWWWDSHVTPKNSKWLQENLTGMDSKVKQMIKLIEEDADSFARRAEMYYKKRPELIKLVEDFYRAYRALAERYDHATGVIRQAHQTMAEAFPNQVPLVVGDDAPAGSTAFHYDIHTPEMPPPTRAHHDASQKDAVGFASHFRASKSNGDFTEKSESAIDKNGLKHDMFESKEARSPTKFGEGRARKGLTFHDAEEDEQSTKNKGNNDVKNQSLSVSERGEEIEMEIMILKKTLAKLEAEKEAGLIKYQQSVEKLSNLESEVSHAKEDSWELSKQADKAKAEVQTLEEVLAKFKAEKEANFLQYRQCVDKISYLESNVTNLKINVEELDERASKAESEADVVKQDIARVQAEMKAADVQYKQSLQIISNLEDKLLHAEEATRSTSERADKAEREVEVLKQSLRKITEERDATALLYQQCLVTISSLEHRIVCIQEEVQRLNCEINSKVSILKGAEERCFVLETSKQSMHAELDSLMQKTGTQSLEISEKQQELGMLSTCIQEERSRFLEVETALKNSQHLHSQSQVELRYLDIELQNKVQILKDMEITNQGLMNEVQKLREDTKVLNEVNLSSALSIEYLEHETLSLRVTIEKLEAEVGLHVDQRSSLQQEIYNLKEELNNMNKKHLVVLEQISAVGLQPELFGSSVKKLQDENLALKETRERDKNDSLSLLENLQIMEKLVEKNAVLDKSISDLNVELNELRGKVESLEESCQSLLGEKSSLVAEKSTLSSQLQIANELIEKLQASLDAAKQERANFALLNETRLAGMESKIQILQEEGRCWKNEYEQQLDKVITAQIEIYVSQKCLQDSKRNYLSLFVECQDLVEASKVLEKLMSSLEHENLQQRVDIKSLSDKIKVLSLGLYRLLKSLNIDADHDFEDLIVQDLSYLNHVIGLVQEVLYETCDENQRVAIEKSVLCTLIEQLRIEAASITAERNIIHREYGIRSERLLALEFEMLKMKEVNEDLRFQILEGHNKEELMTIELENLQEKLLTLHGNYQKLQEENSMVCEEKISLRRDVVCLEEHVCTLEEGNHDLVENFYYLDIFSGILKDIVSQKYVELMELSGSLVILHHVNDKLQQKLRTLEKKLKITQVENSHLKESMEKHEYELKLVRSVGDKLTSEIAHDKDLLCQKENELLKAKQKVHSVESENRMLCKIVDDLKREHVDANHTLGTKLCKLNIELEETKAREEILRYELLKRRNEVDLWESQAATFFGELQISAVSGVLFEEKIHELAESYLGFENRCTSMGIDIDHLNGKVNTLEGENVELKDQLAAYAPAIFFLMECVSSLENHTTKVPTVLKRADNAVIKDANLVSHVPAKSFSQANDQVAMVSNEISNLKDMQMRIRGVEKVMMEMGAMKHIAEIKSHEEGEVGDAVSTNLNVPGNTGNEFITKDIVLDQISECPSYGICPREDIHRVQDYHQIEELKGHKSNHLSSESLFEELGFDKLAISDRLTEPYEEGDKRNILERLDSDRLKLTNLQITVEDLKTKVDITDNTKNVEGMRYDTVKEQIEKAEEAITKLLDINRKLVNNIEDNSFSDNKSAAEANGSRRMTWRRRVVEQAQKGSERIGRLQLEVQRIQFGLLKLDGRRGISNRSGRKDQRMRVQLKDYIYGVGSTSQKKRSSFSSCIRPFAEG